MEPLLCAFFALELLVCCYGNVRPDEADAALEMIFLGLNMGGISPNIALFYGKKHQKPEDGMGVLYSTFKRWT